MWNERYYHNIQYHTPYSIQFRTMGIKCHIVLHSKNSSQPRTEPTEWILFYHTFVCSFISIGRRKFLLTPETWCRWYDRRDQPPSSSSISTIAITIYEGDGSFIIVGGFSLYVYILYWKKYQPTSWHTVKCFLLKL